MKPFYIKPLSIVLISCLGIIIYSNTFHCSFHFDDKVYIIDALAIRNISNLQNIWEFYPDRFVTFLSIAFNYHFDQINVFGYHLFNLGIHLVTAILVWWLTLLTFSTPAMKKEKIARHANVISLFAGLVFVSHPVQTEAVTYIWQRAASMATLFYLASLCFYVKSRLPVRTDEPTGRLYYALSLMTAIVAMFTKEMTITLPLMILLYEYSFLRTTQNFNWKRFSPFLLTLFVIPLTMLFTQSVNFQEMHRVTEDPPGISSIHYLLTQFRVIATYIRLSFLPLNQNLDYNYSVSDSIFELPALISFLFLTIILFFAKHLFSKYRMVSFSIFWFFLTLLPESSFIPFKDIIFEHRVYLPLVGYSMFLVSSMYYLWGENDLKTMTKALILIITCYSILTYQRNNVWKDEITLWDDVIKKSPYKERPYNNRGLAWDQRGNLTQAISDFTKAIEINSIYMNAYINRGFMYNKQGNFTQAIFDYNKAIEINPKQVEAYIDRGNVYDKQGNFTQAISDYNEAIEIDPKYAEAYNDRGNIHFQLGNFTQAISDYSRAIKLKPDYEDAYYNLGLIYYKQGNLPQAISNYSKAIEINPQDTDVYNNRAVSYYQLKEYDKAWDDVHKVEKLGTAVNSQLIRMLKQITGRVN